MPRVLCKICSADFYARPVHIKAGYGKYCSATCHHVGMRKSKSLNCFICEKSIFRPPSKIKHSKSKKFFCSKSCQTKWRNTVFIGPKHANWKTGEHEYRSVLRRYNTPEACKLCGSKNKRVLATHHIDKNRRNNKVDNLVRLCHNCHHLVHYHNVNL